MKKEWKKPVRILIKAHKYEFFIQINTPSKLILYLALGYGKINRKVFFWLTTYPAPYLPGQRVAKGFVYKI